MNIKERYKNARAFIVLLAALITILINIKYKRELVELLVIEIIVILAFYIVSTIAIKLIDKIRNMEVKTKITDENDEATEESVAENTDTSTQE